MVSQALLHIFPTLQLGEHTVKTVQLKQIFANCTQLMIFCGIKWDKAKWWLDLTLYLENNILNQSVRTTVFIA